MSAIDFCIECESKNIEYITKLEELNIRGDKITVTVTYWHCKDCGEDFEQMNKDNDYLDVAYRIYRKRHNMLQPEEIRNLRKKYNLTQGELAEIL
ncbi:MAG: type II TA system antitoxin MqsA family protein [Candidatus Eremiobacterota bacterium]